MIRKLLLTLCLLSPFSLSARGDDPQQLRKGTDLTGLEDLVADLNQKSVLHQVVADQNLVLLPVKHGHLDCMAGMRWVKQTGFLLILVPMIVVESDDRIREIESALARINYDHPSGGFSLAPATREVFFRMSVPYMPAGKLNSTDVTEYFSFSIREASRFKPVFEAVSQGRVAGKDAILYFTTLPPDDNQIPSGTYRKTFGDIHWTLTISEKGETTLLRGESVVVRSTASMVNGVITFTDKQGDLSVETPGRYRIRFPKGKLAFEKVEDLSTDRQKLLTEGDWQLEATSTTPAPANSSESTTTPE